MPETKPDVTAPLRAIKSNTLGPVLYEIRDALGQAVCEIAAGYAGSTLKAWNATLEVRDREIERLRTALGEAKDAIDEAAEWMERIALPALGDDSDGGNALCEGLKHTADEAKDALAGGGA